MVETKKPKILMVDDEQDMCSFVKEALDLRGYDVTTSNDPMSVETIAARLKPDLIFLDIVMPRRNGVEILTALRENAATRAIPIVVISGLGEMVYHRKGAKWQWLPNTPLVNHRGPVIDVPANNYIMAATAYGVDDYIEKPFSIVTLLIVIEKILKKDGGDTPPPGNDPL